MKGFHFRILMLTSATLLALAAAADISAFRGSVGPESVGGSSWNDAATYGAVGSFAFLLLFSAGFVGMYTFKPWGRALSVAVAVVFPLIWLITAAVGNAWSALPSSSFSDIASDLSQLIWGAVLASAYWSPLSAQFIANSSVRSSPSTPGA